MNLPAAAYEHNGQPVGAQAFYAVACDPHRSAVVQACAGAGKTWILVSRVLRALLDGAQPQQILAITFTKKAAGEMRERLFEWLETYARADPVTLRNALQVRGVHPENSPKPISDLLNSLSNLYQTLLDQDRALQIRTFHSWFAALLRTAPISVLQRLDLPVDYELLEDDAPAKAAVWRHFYAALLSRPESKSIYEAVVHEAGRHQTFKALEAALDKRTEFALADAQGAVMDAVKTFDQQYPAFSGLATPDDFFLAHSANRAALAAAAHALGAATAKTYSAFGRDLEMALAGGDVDGMLSSLLTQKGEPRKFSDSIANLQIIRAAQSLAQELMDARHQHASWQFQQRMTALTRLLLASYGTIKRERGWVDMNDVEQAATVLLGDPVLSGWIQERLDIQIRYLLIDEFQDTNPLQWQALRSWLSAYAGAGAQAPSVFIVGDPKQSIYRFRRAEPQVFLAAQTFVQQTLGGDVLSCDHTRRNAQSVLSVVNAAMSQAAREEGYPGFRQHTTASPDLGRVLSLPQVSRAQGTADSDEGAPGNTPAVWRNSLLSPREEPEETLRTLEARQAARWIAQVLSKEKAPEGAPLLPGDVMVLSRKRAGLLCLQAELQKLGIAAQVGEKTELIDCCEVQDLVALMDLLVSPQHDLSLARVLKSPLFSVDDVELVDLALQQRLTPGPWFDLLHKKELITQDGREVCKTLVRWKDWLDALPPHDALQAIYTDGDVLARFAMAAPQAQRLAVQNNLRALLSMALQVDGGRYATPYLLVRKLKAGGVMAPATLNLQAVRLMTIHGAKGLEAHAVLLLDTDTQERNAQTMSVLVDWPGQSASPLRFVFLQSEGRPSACVAESLQHEHLAREREEINAMYVALTRARHLLAVSSIEPRHPAPRSWWARLHPLFEECGHLDEPATALVSQPTIEVSTHFFIQELPMAPSDPSPPVSFNASSQPQVAPAHSPEKAPELTPEQIAAQSNAAIGLAMHRLLEWGAVSDNNTRAVTQEFELTPEQGELAAEFAKRILQGQGAWAWDPAAVGWQGNEVELMFQGEPLRLDRLVQRKDAAHKDEWWVLDYKMASAPEDQPELLEQLQHYRDAVVALYPEAVVRAAFLTGLGTQVELKE